MKQAGWLVAVLGLWAGFAGRVQAVEPAREFLQALRDRGYFDTALDYLDQMASSPLAPAELRESLLYERGVTQVAAARQQRDLVLREKMIDEARQMLEQFLAQRADHPRANAARSEMVNLIIERAKLRLEPSAKGELAARRVEARRLYDEAYGVITKLREELKAQLERIPKFLDPNDPQAQALVDRRTQLRADYLQALLLSAAIREETTTTLDPASPEFAALLADAAKQYGEIYESYRSRLAGHYARMYQGRCLQKLKKFQEALGYLTEVMEQPADDPGFRTLIVKALRHALECWLDPSQKKYVEAINRGESWLQQGRPTEDRDPDWLAVRILLAKAYQMQAAAVKAERGGERLADQSLAAAKKHAALVARIASEHQSEAQSLLAQLGGPDRSGAAGKPQSFDEAKEACREAIVALQAGELLVKELPAQIQREQDAARKAALQKQLDDARQSLARHQEEAFAACQVAIQFATPETPAADLNYVRYLLCFLHFSRGSYFDAAVLGEFVARRFPDDQAARQCGKFALAAYLQLHAANTTSDKEFETARIIGIAEYVAQRWPDQPEAEEALDTLVSFMVNAKQIPRAFEFVAKIPEGAARRGPAELRAGQALWATYVMGLAEVRGWEREGAPAGADLAARRSELDAQRTRALQVLSQGYDRIRQRETIDRSSANALLSLAQVFVESQQPQKAIEVLEQPKLGPLTLVATKHPAADELFVENTYKAALQAYISAMPTATDRPAMQAKAREAMEKLKAAVKQRPDGEQRLVGVFVGLAQELEKQLQVAPPAAKKTLSESFEVFLQQIRAESKDFAVLNWVAETFHGLGGGFDTGVRLTPEAKHFYEESAATFAKILAEVTLEDKLKTQMQVRSALVARRMHDFKKAIDTYREVLTANPMLVNVQVEAAKTYQEWGALRPEPVFYERAIAGFYPDKSGRNIVWGWGRVSQTAARYPQFADLFHEASINLALCRLALAGKKPEEKAKLLQLAANGIQVVYRLKPELGGEKWKPQYEAALMQVQKAQGVAATGLRGLPAAKTTTPEATSPGKQSPATPGTPRAP